MTGRPQFDYRYSIIPGGAVTDPDVSMRDLQVLALLGRHTKRNGWCFRSQVEMADELRCGRATVSRSIKRLEIAGWLEVKPLTRGRAVQTRDQPFAAFAYRVKIDRDDEEDVTLEVDVPNNGHPPVDGPADVSRNGQGVPTIGGQGVPTQVGTHRRINLKDQPNALPPALAGESETVVSLGNGAPERFADFRGAIGDCWPDGFPAANEIAARKAWDKITRSYDPDLVIACARLHGAAKTAARDRRRSGDGREMVKLPANWLSQGDWQGYIPQAQAAIVREGQIAQALDNVRRSLGHGLFDLLRRKGLSDGAIAALEGCALEAPSTITVSRPVQRTVLERYFGDIERLLRDRPEFVLVRGAA